MLKSNIEAFCVLRLWGPDLCTSTNEKVPYVLCIHTYGLCAVIDFTILLVFL